MKRDISVFKLFVPDDGTAIEFLRNLRWEDGVYCPCCRSFKITKQGNREKHGDKATYIATNVKTVN